MHALIAVQVAFCFLVLFVAGLFAATFDRLSHRPTGFSAERLLTLDTVDAARCSRRSSGNRWPNICARCRASRRWPGRWPLLSGGSWNGFISVNGAPPGPVLAYFLNVSPGWIDTMKIPLIDGRDFRAERHVSRRGDRQRNVREAILQRRRIPLDNRSRKAAQRPTRSWAWSATLPIATCASPSCRWPMFRFVRSMRTAHCSRYRRRRSWCARSSANPLALASTLRREVPQRAARIPRQQHPHPGGTGAGANRARAAAGDAGAVLRGGRAVARGRRTVWRAGLFGVAAAAGNRHSHGDRRASRRHRAAGDRGCLVHGAGRRGGGPGARAWCRCGTSRRCSTR